jgi:hypothetical protein
MSEPPVTNREFSMLADRVKSNELRLDSIDTMGTRGIGTVQLQITELAKDLAGLNQRMDSHEKEHKQETTDRRSSRRFWITTTIAAYVALQAPLAWLIYHLH